MKSAIVSSLSPVNAAVPPANSEDRSAASADRCESPARQLLVLPTSPPTWANTVRTPTPSCAAPAAGNASPRSSSAAELDEQRRRRHPFDLHAGVLVRLIQHGDVRERRIVEVPRMRMDRVQIADVREELPGLDLEPFRQRQRLEVAFLELDRRLAAVLLNGGGQKAVVLVVDVRADRELRLVQRQTFGRQTRLRHRAESPATHSRPDRANSSRSGRSK